MPCTVKFVAMRNADGKNASSFTFGQSFSVNDEKSWKESSPILIVSSCA